MQTLADGCTMEGWILGNQNPQIRIRDVAGDVYVVVVAAAAMLVATGIEVGGIVVDFYLF